MCQHNNIQTYCPSCLRQGLNGGPMNRSFGAYELIPGTGIMVPDAGELINAAGAGATSIVGQNLAQSTAVKEGALTAAGNTLGQKIVKFYSENTVAAVAGTVVVGGLLVYGLMSFVRGK